MANLRKFSAPSPMMRPSTQITPAPPAPPSGLRTTASLHPSLAMSYMGDRPRNMSSITGRVLRKHSQHQIAEDFKQEVRMAFQLFDFRNVGKLNYRELKAAMRALEFNVKKAEVRLLVDKFAKDYEDEVNYEEFMEISYY